MEELQLALGGDVDPFYTDLIKTNLEDRRLVFNKGVDASIIEDINLYILKWNKEDKGLPVENRKPIWIYLTSNGGDVISGLSTCDTIVTSKTPVYGVVIGVAASMACYLSMAFHKTYAFKNSVFLLHDGSCGVQNSTKKMKDTMKFYDELDDRVEQFVLDNSNITKEFYEEIYDSEYYMFANKAKELGIVDYIIGEDCSLDDIL